MFANPSTLSPFFFSYLSRQGLSPARAVIATTINQPKNRKKQGEVEAARRRSRRLCFIQLHEKSDCQGSSCSSWNAVEGEFFNVASARYFCWSLFPWFSWFLFASGGGPSPCSGCCLLFRPLRLRSSHKLYSKEKQTNSDRIMLENAFLPTTDHSNDENFATSYSCFWEQVRLRSPARTSPRFKPRLL